MGIVLLKSILIGVMTTVSVIFGLLPIKMIRVINDPSVSLFNGRSSLIISLLSCFAGGVFLSVCFLDMLPDALESWENAKKDMNFESDYPFVTLITLCSFFVVYIFEEASACCCNIPHSHEGHDDFKPAAAVPQKNRDRFATVGSLFNADGEIVKPRTVSVESAEDHGGEARISRSIVFVAAFLLHVFLECFAFGVQQDIKSTTSLFIGIIVHKAIVMFSIGMKLTRNHPERWWIVVGLILTIAFCNVMGGVIGILIESSNMNITGKELTTSILMSISLGTFLFISFFEMLGPERANQHSNVSQWIAAVLGFILIAGIMAI